MTAKPRPPADLMGTICAPDKRQKPGWTTPPSLVRSTHKGAHLRAESRSKAVRTTDVPEVHAGPITQTQPAAILALAQRGQQNPKCVIGMCSLADAHIFLYYRQLLPGPDATISMANCNKVDVKALKVTGPLRPLAPGPPQGPRQGCKIRAVAGDGAAPSATRALAGVLDHGVPLDAALPGLAVQRQASPPDPLHRFTGMATSSRAAQNRSQPWAHACCGRQGDPEVCNIPPNRRRHRAHEMPMVWRQVLRPRGDDGAPGVTCRAHRCPGGGQGGGLSPRTLAPRISPENEKLNAKWFTFFWGSFLCIKKHYLITQFFCPPHNLKLGPFSLGWQAEPP